MTSAHAVSNHGLLDAFSAPGRKAPGAHEGLNLAEMIMNRAEILAQYRVEHGIIRNPGKFEGEAFFLPYFYERCMDGCADESFGDGETQNTVDILMVTDEDRAEFPEIDPTTVAIAVEYTEQGFVLLMEMSQDELDTFRRVEEERESSEEEI